MTGHKKNAGAPAGVSEMIINYVPGEECRIAITHNQRLEEYHAERMDAASHVGSIYVGKVINVEPSIQAAFVDFGLEHNGFLHVSDLHPKYFPGEGDETTELVGKKTPRRERPPIQECLRRGQEIAVQVLKEGVGTKGPTLTSYLSIPGRYLVMMPQMDRVGVSRKVDDDELRQKMREILDQLELPDGFGFIVRTAGLDRTKAELKRDLAYLMRLWKDMEKRWKQGNKPRLLYSESDLLVRALRDVLTADISRIVIDHEGALNRAARFLKIVSPRSATGLVHYKGRTPIFHAMGIDPQIQMIYAREVPLPSGGRLVIDETEALVAIDVNSGRMRNTKDAETTAFRTNQEAADEICRQIRLRDLGGVIVNDLIDMRPLKNRRDIENRFKDNLKRDRARSTLATISQFGILEMTRQRMRGSQESMHFAGCPTCRGRGLVQRPDSVVADAMRDLAVLLEHERVARVEIVVAPRIAGELLSGKRRALARLERLTGKHVDARVSEAAAVDRVTFYAYDARGADIDIAQLPTLQAPQDQLVEFALDSSGIEEDQWTEDVPAADPDAALEEDTLAQEKELAEMIPLPGEEMVQDEPAVPRSDQSAGDTGERRGRRRRRGGRGRGAHGGPDRGGARDEHTDLPTSTRAGRDESSVSATEATTGASPDQAAAVVGQNVSDGEPSTPDGDNSDGRAGRGRRGRRRRGRGRRQAQDASSGESGDSSAPPAVAHDNGASEPHAPSTGEHVVQTVMIQPSMDATVQGDRADHALNGEDGQRRGRRRRRRGRRGRGRGQDGVSHPDSAGNSAPPTQSEEGAPPSHDRPTEAPSGDSNGRDGGGDGRGRRRRRRGRGRGGRSGEGEKPGPTQTPQGEHRPSSHQAGKSSPASVPERAGQPAPSRPRSLYGAARRRLGPSERPNYDRE